MEERSLGEVPSKEGEDSVSGHCIVFTTDQGHETIDWRNDSNGYYDGSASFNIVANEG